MRNSLSGLTNYLFYVVSLKGVRFCSRRIGHVVNFCAKKEEKLAYPKLVVFPCHYSFLDISKRSVGESSKSFSNRFEAANSIKKNFTAEGLGMC